MAGIVAPEAGHSEAPWTPILEALGLIAFGQADGFTREVPADANMRVRWGDVPFTGGSAKADQYAFAPSAKRTQLAMAMRTLMLRVQWLRRRKPGERAGCPLPKLGHCVRQRLRSTWRYHLTENQGERVLFRALYRTMICEITLFLDGAGRPAQMQSALETLRREAAAGRVRLFGRPGRYYGDYQNGYRSLITSTRHELIPTETLMNRHRVLMTTFDKSGHQETFWLAIDRDLAPQEQWFSAGECDYTDVVVESQGSRFFPIVPRLEPEIEISAARALPNQRPFNGADYRAADESLIPAMREMIRNGKATSAEDAARALVDKIPGNGKPESKIKRLAKRYRENANTQS
jgi:hypothetical protein